MKVKIDDEVIFEITDVDFGLISDYVKDPIPDIKRRLEWVISHLCEVHYKKFHEEWLQKFENDPSILNVPVKREDFCRMVFKHPSYKNRKEREAIASEIQEI
jgi:hypothetical protein